MADAHGEDGLMIVMMPARTAANSVDGRDIICHDQPPLPYSVKYDYLDYSIT